MPKAIPTRRPHGDQARRESDRRRLTAQARGYGPRWARARQAALTRMVIENVDFRCTYCRRDVAVSLDHAVPPTRLHPVGSAEYHDLFWDERLWVPTCLSCNNMKGDRLPRELPEWMRERLLAVLAQRWIPLASEW